MSLRVLTAGGRSLILGSAPVTAMTCMFCGGPAQLVADTGTTTVAACANCTTIELSLAAKRELRLRGAPAE